MSSIIPIIDLFAGPGGLGEGFSALGQHEGMVFFKILLSIEKEKSAYRTLRLRNFFRQFPFGQAPEEYYDFLRGKISSEDELFAKFQIQAEKAFQESRLFELGKSKNEDAKLDGWIEETLHGENKWVLIGGPPCQAYSVMGRVRKAGQIGYKPEDDIRNYLYLEYLRIIAKHRPPVFVMENVQGILSSKVNGQRVFDNVISDLRRPSPQCSYEIHSLSAKRPRSIHPGVPIDPMDYVIESERYGIPQARHRVILLGIREDLSHIEPDMLSPVQTLPLSDVLMDLPQLRSGLSREIDSTEAWCRVIHDGLERRWLKGVRRYQGNELANMLVETMSSIHGFKDERGGQFVPQPQKSSNKIDWWYRDPRLGGVCNHETRSHMSTDLWRYLFASCFTKVKKYPPKLQDFPADLLPAHENAKSGHFDDRFRVQQEDRPSNTITSHIAKDGHYYIHPDPYQCRSLTVREAARLQTFPDNYFFCGNRTEQYVQVGNAVPPLLAYKIAGIIKNIMDRAD
jgi:DNA (cytosine-5)-methyltransferase 1